MYRARSACSVRVDRPASRLGTDQVERRGVSAVSISRERPRQKSIGQSPPSCRIDSGLAQRLIDQSEGATEPEAMALQVQGRDRVRRADRIGGQTL
jgi:hypothetical protein